ncbi:uncharacterized protein LOC106664156 [Cimex lectularius]|uniref:Uncharacterized protein n=1 Tax=Cimex lectularius TaxID=79782 RepID=A0A8I6RFB1_CIMLE|nr:uncharacterized protein LOC106664156 [Cimex lectularius]
MSYINKQHTRNINESKKTLLDPTKCVNPSRALKTSMEFISKIKNYMLSTSPRIQSNVKYDLVGPNNPYRHILGSTSNVRNKFGHSLIYKRNSFYFKHIRQLNTSTHAYGKKVNIRGSIQTSKAMRDRFIPPNKIPDFGKPQKQLDERFTVTPHAISLKPKKKGFPDPSIMKAWQRSTIAAKALPQQRPKVPLSFTQKVVMKKEIEQIRQRKIRRRLTQEDLVPQMFPRTSLQMRKSFLPLEPCKRVDMAERKQERVMKLNEPQHTGIFSTMKNFLKTTFKRY